MMNVLWTKLVITHVVLIPAIVGLIASAMSSTTNPCAMLQQDSLETPKLNVKNVSDFDKIRKRLVNFDFDNIFTYELEIILFNQ